MNQYLSQMKKLPERGNLESILEKWELLENRKSQGIVSRKCILTNLFLLSAAGSGKSNLLNLISQYLKTANLMDFCGEEIFFEFRLEYCSEREEFKELNRFVKRVGRAAGFRNCYKGIICIELDEWKEHYNERYFKVFLEYLEEFSDDWLLIFNVENKYDGETAALFAFLSMYFRLERLQLEIPDTVSYTNYVVNYLNECDFEVTESAEKMIAESIDTIRNSDYFDGYKSIRRLAQDLIYSAYTQKDYTGRVITDKEVEPFSSNSEYILRIQKNYQKKKMGFVSED